MTHAEDLAAKYAYWCGRLETLVAVLAADGATDADREAAAATLAEYRQAFPTDGPPAGTGRVNGPFALDAPTICDFTCFYERDHSGPHQRWMGDPCDVQDCPEPAKYRRGRVVVCAGHRDIAAGDWQWSNDGGAWALVPRGTGQ
jgi:hypothetical protein